MTERASTSTPASTHGAALTAAAAHSSIAPGRLVGARQPRLEDPRLLTGHGRYVDDLQPLHDRQGLLHVAFRRSEQAHARIVSMDLSAARAVPGVIAVLSAADLQGLRGPVLASSRMKNYYATPIWPLAQDKVRYVGEAVVAVLAESRYIAEDAAELVQIEFDVLPAIDRPEDALAEGAPLLHEAAGTNLLLQRGFTRGDPDAVMASAAVRVQGRFRMHRKCPLAMEPRSYLAEFDAGQRSLTLHASTQVPGIIRDALVDLLELPGNRLRVVAPDVGGGFGGKTSLYMEELLVCVLARQFARPVKWTSDRLEDLSVTTQGFDEVIEAELGLDAEGNILALQADVLADVGAYSIYPWTAALEPVQVISFMPGPYRVSHYRGAARGVATPKVPLGPFRGVGRPTSTFVMERLMDMAAARLGCDPLALRQRNLVRAEEFPYKTPSGIVWDRSGFQECLAGVVDAGDYAAMRAAQRQARREGRLMGIGLACYAELTGIGSRISASPGMPINTGTETATIRIDSAGGITARFGVSSHGQSLETTLAQVIADQLGVGIHDIRILQGDSDGVAHGTGTYASRSAVLAGGAATLSARGLGEKLRRVAGLLLEAAPADIVLQHGQAQVAGTDRAVSLREIARAVYSDMGRLPPEAREELSHSETYDPFFGTCTSASHLVQLEIDPHTCAVHIQRYLVAEDCGQMINPMVVDGQIHGAVAQGVGAALFEEVMHDSQGQLLSASLVDYVMPAAPEVPHIETVHLELPQPDTVGGFRGMGEGGTIGAPAAIANAIADALAPLVREAGAQAPVLALPVTPERLFQILQALQKS